MVTEHGRTCIGYPVTVSEREKRVHAMSAECGKLVMGVECGKTYVTQVMKNLIWLVIGQMNNVFALIG